MLGLNGHDIIQQEETISKSVLAWTEIRYPSNEEVLDRVPLPSLEVIPDQQAVEAQGISRWRVPSTSIDIVRVGGGPGAGEFLFDPRTVAQAPHMYRALRQLPYLARDTMGL